MKTKKQIEDRVENFIHEITPINRQYEITEKKLPKWQKQHIKELKEMMLAWYEAGYRQALEWVIDNE